MLLSPWRQLRVAVQSSAAQNIALDFLSYFRGLVVSGGTFVQPDRELLYRSMGSIIQF